mmetsp:Transcript_128812/g.358650  ORF Transcript_128812/g.358650 Transcript_128812/m.358650 type:complete len:100 (+) Transcript_128812:363-662(+)
MKVISFGVQSIKLASTKTHLGGQVQFDLLGGAKDADHELVVWGAAPHQNALKPKPDLAHAKVRDHDLARLSRGFRAQRLKRKQSHTTPRGSKYSRYLGM